MTTITFLRLRIFRPRHVHADRVGKVVGVLLDGLFDLPFFEILIHPFPDMQGNPGARCFLFRLLDGVGAGAVAFPLDRLLVAATTKGENRDLVGNHVSGVKTYTKLANKFR